jgi:predicted PurR-regulated permease PerM
MAVDVPPEARSPANSSLPLKIIAVGLTVAALWYAQELLIPLLSAALLSYALRPIHRRLVAVHVPSALAAGIVLTAVIGLTGAGVVALHGQVTAFADRLPALTQQLRQAIQSGRGAFSSTVQPVQQAANELKKAADETGPPPARGVTRVQVEEPPMRLSDLLWRGTVGVVGVATQAMMVFFLVFYLLTSGDSYKQRLVRIAGPSLLRRRITIEILDDITAQIERFIMARIVISAIVGVATGLAVWWLGLSQPAVWGLAAGILNNIPYLGPSVAVAAATLAAFVQFGTLAMAGAVCAVTTLIAFIEGFVITPWLMGRAGNMNTGMVFVGLMFWGWVWGVWGLLFAVPIMMSVKAFCDHVPEYRYVSEWLRE